MTQGKAAEAMTDRLAYRLDVVGLDVADVVADLGGWIFDRALDGWDITVMYTSPPRDTASDARALQILGAAAGAGTAGLADRRPDAVAVSAAALRANPELHAQLEVLQAGGDVTITVWGDDAPGPQQVCHRVSTAARAFKAQALLAADGGCGPIGTGEVYRHGLTPPAAVEHTG